MKKKAIDWTVYPVRTCMYMNSCRLCGKTISAGQQYADGGYSRRAHVQCCLKRIADLELDTPADPGEEGKE